MPAIGAGRESTNAQPKKKRAVKKKAAGVSPSGDMVDRSGDHRAAPKPRTVVKQRIYANPGTPRNQEIARDQERTAQKKKARRVEVKDAVRKMDAKPSPSPDAKDTTRSREQRAHDKDVSGATIRDTRRRYVTKRGRGAGVRAVKRELEGKGKIAEALKSLGERANRNVTGGGGGPMVATIKPRKLGATKLLGRAAQDLVNFPAQAIPSVYVPVAGGVEAAKGRPQRLKQLAKDIDEGDPLYNLGAAAVEKIGGDSKSAKKRLDAAGKAASEHPGFAALEVVGAKGTTGRMFGRAGRSDAAGKRVKKAASTAREPRTLPGTSLREDRAYSKDVITKGTQVVVEKGRKKVARKFRDSAAKHEKTNPELAEHRRSQAEIVDPSHISEREIQKRVDEHVDTQETVRRMHRGEVVNETRKDVKAAGAHKTGPVANLVVQGIAHADPDDLRAYVAELKGERDSLGPAGKRANKQLVKGIEKALDKHSDGKVDFKALGSLAAKYREGQAKREGALDERRMLAAEEGALAAAKPYAVRRMEAKWDDKAGLVDKHGDPLSLDDIHAHMKKHDEPIPSWLSQGRNARGARNFYVSSAKPPNMTGEPRTGAATRVGSFDAHPDTLVEGAARQQGLVDAFDGFHSFLDEFGLKGDDGKITTAATSKLADDAIHNAAFDKDGTPIPGAVKMRKIRVNPFGGRQEQLAKMLEGTPSEKHAGAQQITHAITKALDGDGDGEWAIVPDVAAKRLQGHVGISGKENAGQIAQKVQSQFRKTVLSTSLPWMAGNATEGAMRAALAGAGPRSYATGRRVAKRRIEINKEAGERASARTTGGGHFGSVERQRVHLNVDAMDPGKIKETTRVLSALWKAPGPKQVAGAWHLYTHVVMDVINKTLENTTQTTMAGKALHDSNLMDAPLLKASEAAIDKAARGSLDINTASALGRQVDVMYGKYGKWSPSMRKSIALYTPFIAWTLNSTYFLLRTLPRDHPTATALTASLETATEEWRKEHGLDKFIDEHLPEWLQGSIPGPGGTHFRAPARYTPFSLGADPLGAYAGAVLPAASGMIAAGKGKDWQGHDLKDDSDYGKAEAAIVAMLDGTIPFLSLGKRVAKKGVKGATLDTVVGKVEPSKKSKRARRSSAKPGFQGGSSGGGFVGGGGSSGGFVR